MTIDEARVWLQRHADNTPMLGAREVYETILEALEKMRWIPGSVKPTDDYDILKRDVESLRDENKALRRGYTNMWYAHRNADPEMPHDYEKEAEKEAEQLLGDWETVMTAQYGPAPDLSWFKERGDDDGN